ncbi:MAG: tyrosine-type recombinase/integrase, partial [Sphingomonas oligoaromativorans]
VSDIKRVLVQRYIDWRKVQPSPRRKGQTISGATISRELAALRASLRHAWENELIPSAPFIPDIAEKDRPGPKELVYSAEQVARILEAARRLEERWHVHLFCMIMLSTHGRGEAILELDAETQIRDGLIYFNAPGRAQTKKRRSIVPIAPTLAPWLADIKGKVIRYRTRMKDPKTDEWLITYKPTLSIRTAFDACLIEAGICEQETDEQGNALWLPPRAKLGETARRPKMKPIGSSNTLRHTISTELHKRGVPDAQIDAAAGHAGTGTNKKNYRHLRPDYLGEFVAGVEDYWMEVGQFTKAHLRSQCDPKVIDLASKRIRLK